MSTTATPAAPATTAAPAAPAAPAVVASTSGAISAPAAPAVVGTPAAVSTETVNPGAWMAGFSDDLKGWVGNKGFKAPAELADAYRGLEKLRGVPEDRLLKLPESFYDDKGVLTTEGRSIYERLGAPKEAKAYELEMPKEGGDPALMENFSKVFHEAGIPKAAAQKIAKEWNAYQQNAAAAAKEVMQTEFNNQVQALKKDWGAAMEQNTRIASDGARKLGLEPAKIDALSSVLGHAETMKLLASIGKATGEATFVNGRPPATAMEPASAKSRIQELTSDKDFGARLMNGDAGAKAEWQRLHEFAYQGMVNV